MEGGNSDEKTIEKQKRFFNSNILSFNSTHILNSFIVDVISSFENDLEQAKRGSDLTLLSIDKLDIKTAKSKAIVGGSYIPLPDFISKKQACINIINDDEKCFIWSILASKHYNEIKGGCKNKASTYKKYLNEIKEPDGVTYPLDIDFVPEFEKLNNLKINIFELKDGNSEEEKKEEEEYNLYIKQSGGKKKEDQKEDNEYVVKILYHSYNKYKDVVNLLWFEKDGHSHYVWIKDLNRLDKHNVATHASMYRCDYCLLQRFLTKEKLFNHIKTCSVSYVGIN